jgi:hypothetical protein
MASQLLDYFAASNDLRFDLVTVNYISSALGSGSATAAAICPTKPNGLSFSLNTSQLNIPQLNGFDFEIAFTGQDGGFNGTEQRIIWSASQQNISKPIPGTPAILDSIQGQFISVLTSLGADVESTNCAGAPIFYGVLFQTPDAMGQINLKGHVPVPVLPDVAVNVDATISIEGVVGAPHLLSVKIQNQGGFCSNPILVGSQATSAAYISGVPANATPTYKWTVQGAAIVGPDNQWKVRYTIPGPNAINISVIITAGDQAATAKTTIYGITQGVARLEQLICELRTTAIINIWFNPLIDPLISGLAARLTNPSELRRLVESATQIERLAEQIRQVGNELSRSVER